MPLDSEAQDELRFALRRYLAARPTAACTMDMIGHAMAMKGIDASHAEIEAELTYWIGLGEPEVKQVNPKHSTTKAWQITSLGRLNDHRGN